MLEMHHVECTTPGKHLATLINFIFTVFYYFDKIMNFPMIKNI